MTESIILAIVGAIQATTLGYLELLRRGQRKIITNCNTKKCQETIEYITAQISSKR